MKMQFKVNEHKIHDNQSPHTLGRGDLSKGTTGWIAS